MKMTDSPGAMVLIPTSGSAAAKDAEESSTFQPVTSTAWAVVFVTSNQSAEMGVLPLAQGATSETKSRPTVPGEPISFGSPAAANAPLTPTTLSCEMAVLFSPAALLNDASGPVGDVPCLVVTHHAPARSYPSVFTFVTDGVAGAIEQAQQVAGDKVVHLFGATVMQQALPLGLVDEIHVHVVASLIGGGTPLFGMLDRAISLVRTRAVITPAATHLNFRDLR